ncbi:MAG TPA: hypothetical protein VK727_07040 [Steroidobacteraceae bacterium]|nr:hypothetical protein [Steroidobacteraceae bacterium]
MSKVLSVLVLSLAATSAAHAFETAPPWVQHAVANHEALKTDHDGSKSTAATDPPAAAPEIDPAGAMSAFTLLAGGLAVLRSRRSVQKRKD